MLELIFIPVGYLVQKYIHETLFPDDTLNQSLINELFIFLMLMGLSFIFSINILIFIMLTIGSLFRIFQKELK